MTNLAMQNKRFIRAIKGHNIILIKILGEILPILIIGVVVSSCSSVDKIFSSKDKGKTAENQGAYGTKFQILDSVVKSWLGVPYRYGGTTKSGVDCSGLVRSIYKEAFQIDLPRSTTELLSIIQGVDENNLQPGDLVFYEIEKEKEFHVGIYLGSHKFVHASSTKGVMMSSMEEPYFKQRFYRAGKIKNSLIK